MNEFTPSEIAVYYATMAPAVQQTGTEWRGACVVHQGKNLSFSVNSKTGFAKCHSKCGEGWDVIGLHRALTGDEFPKAKASVYEIVGRQLPTWEERDIEAVYDYTD